MTRTPQEVYSAHAEALAAGDIPRMLDDFTDDAILITADRSYEGRGAVSDFFSAALGALGDVEFTLGSMVFAGDALLVSWTASSLEGRIDDGVDTFVFTDGKIRLQTTSFHVVPA